MAKRLTNDQFIERASNVHKNRYNYDLVNYVNNKTKVKIICNKHGIFSQIPKDHLRGTNCPKCSSSSYDTEEFIERAKLVHNSTYGYDKTNYINSSTKVTIHCIACNKYFEQLPNNHLNGSGCGNCRYIRVSESLTNSSSQFISKSIKIHGHRYNYSLVDYTGYNKEVIIICQVHGNFKQKPTIHLKGSGCTECASDSYRKLYTKDTHQFIESAIKVHGSDYDYSLVNYSNAKQDIMIICQLHGVFTQQPHNHLRGSGCPVCSISKGEKRVMEYLDQEGFLYAQQKEFDGCFYINKLRFDFYLPNENICIEYDGRQHFESVEFWGGDEYLHHQIKLDNIKNEFCRDNNIQLIRIPYWDYNQIEPILENVINIS